MLSSIHPLGERARQGRWSRTVTSFTIASVVAGAAVGAVLGGAGALVVASPGTTAVAILGVAAAVAGALDFAGVDPLGPHRQVNERWIGVYRDWVYGGGFGFQLGAGVTTYVVTWGVWATLLAEFLTASAASGALVGATFGAGRAVPVIGSRWIDRPSRLVSAGETLGRIARPAWRGLASATALAGLTMLATAVM